MTTSGSARQGVFISYARADGETAARSLHARLAAEAPDVPAWLDRYEIEGGIGWWNQIERELDQAEFLLLVMTPAAMHSENTRREWHSARQRGVCVYPVKAATEAELDYASLPNWMRKAHFYSVEMEWQKLLAHLRRGCQATRVPFMAPPLPASFVARPRETEALIELLLSRQAGGTAVTTALRGPGGFGKTTLAAAVCHADRVIDAFDDGILWVTLGQTPNLLNELVKLYAALTGERPGFVDVEDAVRELALRLETKNCLIVIDDAWSSEHIRPFLRGAAGCARLITTRLFEVAVDAQRVEVDQMTPDEALQLLLARAGARPPDLAACRSLVARLGAWPLPIKLAGSALRLRVERGETVDRALDYVARALAKRGITAFDREETAERGDAVALTVGASLDLLANEERRRCAELAIFPEDVAIPLGAAAGLWQLDDIDSEDLARRLDDLALVEFDLRRGMLRLHDVLRGFLAARLTDIPRIHGRLIEAWGNPYALPDTHAWRTYAFHLAGAGRDAALRRLLLDPAWLGAKLAATDIHRLIGDFAYAARDPVLNLVCDALRLSAPGLASDRRQLRTQLVARLQARDELDIVALLDALLVAPQGPWLRLLHPTLDAPGGMLQMTLVGHQGGVSALAVGGDGRWLLSASDDGSVRVWDTRDGQLVRTLNHRDLGARALAVSADGRVAVSGGADGLLYRWDVDSGERRDCFSGEARSALTAVALSADASIAVSASREHALRVWRCATHEVLHVLQGHGEQVTAVAMTADAMRAVSGAEDCSVRVWNLRSGELERTLEGHTGGVNAVTLSADGRHVLSGASDRTLKLWDADHGVCLLTLSGHEASVTAVALANGAWRALSGSSDHSVRLWDLRSGHQLARLEGHSDAVRAVAIDDAGVRAASGSADRSIKLWRLDDLRPQAPVDAHAGAVRALAFSPDGRLCASGGADGRVRVREVGSGRVVRVIDAHVALVRSLAFTADGGCVLSAGIDDDQYWQWTLGDEEGNALPEGVWMPIRHLAPIDHCALSATARYLATSCGDRFVYLWDVPSGVRVARYGTRRLFDHLIEPAARRRELADGDEYLDLYLPGETVYEVVIVGMSPAGRHAILSATASDPGSIRHAAGLRGTSASGACLLVLDLDSGEVHSVSAPQAEAVIAFATDVAGSRLLWARADCALELWDLEREERLSTLPGHTDKVNAVALSRDGRRAYSCARDRSLRVWDLQSGEVIAAFTADAALRALALAPDDATLAAGDEAGRVHLLQLCEP